MSCWMSEKLAASTTDLSSGYLLYIIKPSTEMPTERAELRSVSYADRELKNRSLRGQRKPE